uniref:Uncharacterized protein n=1 Tax=Arundo donax TaxID=35708 RepID=A0A0A9H567_ARUDO
MEPYVVELDQRGLFYIHFHIANLLFLNLFAICPSNCYEYMPPTSAMLHLVAVL